jgi:ABC-type branched-subunit amino acid transport system substrate-binding protein
VHRRLVSGQRRWAALAASVVVVAAVAAGCGSSSSGSSSSGSAQSGASGDSASSSTTAATKLTGAPVKIMTMTPVTASSGTAIISPETAQSAEATTHWINEHGGIGGRPLDDIVCNEQSDPNQAAACARQAVADHVIAMVGTYSQYSNEIYPIIQPAGIVNLGEITVTNADFSSPISYPIAPGPTVLPGVGELTGEQKQCTKPGLVQIQNTAAAIVQAGIEGGAKEFGAKPAYSITLPANATDFSAQAAQAAHSGNCLMLFDVPGNALAFIPAFRSVAPTTQIIASNNAITAEVAKKLGATLNGTLVPDYFPPYDSPALAQYRSIMAQYPIKYQGSDLSYTNAINAYAAVRVFAEVASKLKTITPQTFAKALGSDKAVNTFGLTPTLNFTPSGQWVVPPLKRIFNRNMVFEKIENGKFVQIDGGFHNLSVSGAKAFAG